MPLEGLPKVVVEGVGDSLEEKEIEKQFGKLLEVIQVPDEIAKKALDKKEKFDIILNQTENLIKYAGNRFIYFLKTSNYNKFNYIGIDDYTQDVKMMLWMIVESNGDKPIGELLKIFKTALWRITADYFRRSYLKKNAGRAINQIVEREEGGSESIENFIHKQTKTIEEASANEDDFQSVFDRLDLETAKEAFSKYINRCRLVDKNDKTIFDLLAYPKPDFIDFCYKNNYSKKKKHHNILNQSNIARYMNVSISYIHNRLKKLALLYKKFIKEEKYV